MDVTYFYRNQRAGYSIAKVFKTLKNELRKYKSVEECFVPRYRANLFSVLQNMIYVFKHRNKHGINHITGEIHYCVMALIGCKSVLTIHDISALDCIKNPVKKWMIRMIWFKLPLKFSDKIICISDHTKEGVMKLTRRNDIEVIYNSVDPMFSVHRKQFNTERPVILQVGTAWNKNLKNVIQALRGIPCHLSIIGAVDELMLNILVKNNISYEINVGLTDEKLLQQYRNCDIVSFCSIYEGFGMPIIEGNAVGRCVLTSFISPMTEVASYAAVLVDPSNTHSIESGFRRIISDAVLRRNLIENGMINIVRFSVAKAALKHIKLYENLK